MAYTEADYQALRDDTGKTEATLNDEAAQVVFDRAATLYSAGAVFAGARILILRPDWQKATELADMTQNEESERLSQIAEAKRKYLAYWQGLVDEATKLDVVSNRASAVRSGRTKRKPARVMEYPG